MDVNQIKYLLQILILYGTKKIKYEMSRKTVLISIYEQIKEIKHTNSNAAKNMETKFYLDIKFCS